MECEIGEVDGDKWEEYCHKLLRLRHQTDDYHEVPSKYGGDLGIEGFTRNGLLYQCYCPEGYLSEGNLYEKQRDKITKDIRKLKTKEGEICKLLGNTKVSKWIFLTPDYDNKKIIRHCNKKKNKVSEWDLGYVEDGFDIVLKTEDDFIEEVQILVGGSDEYLITYSVDNVHEEDIQSLEEDSEVFTDELERKIGKLTDKEENKNKIVRKNLKSYIRGQNILEETQEKFPDQYERIMRLKNAKEEEIEYNVMYKNPKRLDYLVEEMDNYNKELKDEFGNTIDPGTIKLLSQEAISDWLIRCPIEIS